MRHWSELHGHSLTRDEVAQRTGLAPAEVASSPNLVRFGGRWSQETYPAAQFDASGAPAPGIADLTAAVAGLLPPGDVAAFVTTPLAALGGRTPIAWLQNGGSVDFLVRSVA
jgi:hypothetical protein